MSFVWHGERIPFFDAKYNATITNERAVELPIAYRFLNDVSGVGLEVGNVLAHYGDAAERRVVDKYEQAPHVDNVDVFAIEGSYDWIVSISTLEHVGDALDGFNPWAPIAALFYLRGLLFDDGRMLVTIGLGQNPTLDRFLLNQPRALGCRTQSTITRWRGERPDENWWLPTTSPDLPDPVPYGPTHGANAVWIGEW